MNNLALNALLDDLGIIIKPITPHTGAEIVGLDISKPFTPQQTELLQQLLARYHVLTFCNQPLTHDQLEQFGRVWGELYRHPNSTSVVPGHPDIMKVDSTPDSKTITGLLWHSDISCAPEPPDVSVLHVTVTPPCGGDTMFVNMHKAYLALSERMRVFLETLRATHDSTVSHKPEYYEKDKKFPHAVHPVVRIHPITGEKALFVSKSFTSKINGLTLYESEAILEMLDHHISHSAQCQARISWTPNQTTVWDNRSTVHKAIWDYQPHYRHGFRVTAGRSIPLGVADITK